MVELLWVHWRASVRMRPGRLGRQRGALDGVVSTVHVHGPGVSVESVEAEHPVVGGSGRLHGEQGLGMDARELRSDRHLWIDADHIASGGSRKVDQGFAAN